MNNLIVRLGALLGHAFFNIIIVSYATGFDIAGSWLAVTGFFLLLFLLFVLFAKHLISFINYIKTKTK